MRATGYAMHGADDKSGMGVLVGTPFTRGVSVSFAVGMVVDVGRAIVGMGVGVQASLETAAQTPDPNRDQEHPDETLGPPGHSLDRENLPRH
jgi:hypothetical protein